MLAGATTIPPAALGLGTADWVMRHLVSMKRDEAIAGMTTRVAMPMLLHMLAMHKDRTIALVSVGGAIASAILNLALVPAFGLAGTAYAYFLASGATLTPR